MQAPLINWGIDLERAEVPAGSTIFDKPGARGEPLYGKRAWTIRATTAEVLVWADENPGLYFWEIRA